MRISKIRRFFAAELRSVLVDGEQVVVYIVIGKSVANHSVKLFTLALFS